MKVGMDSIMASYFALFEVINHSFGKSCACVCCTSCGNVSDLFSHSLLFNLHILFWGFMT